MWVSARSHEKNRGATLTATPLTATPNNANETATKAK